MSETEFKEAEIDLTSEDFEKHAEFLSKVTVQKSESGKFILRYPKKFSSYQQLWRYFEYLLWFWFMTSVMEREEQKQSKNSVIDYAR